MEVALLTADEKRLLRLDPRTLAEEEKASETRLAEPGYAARLLAVEYEKKHPSAEKRLRDLVRQSVKGYIDIFSSRLNIHYPEFRIRDFYASFEQLTYEAHDAQAVKSMVEEILLHYELAPNLYPVQVVYSDGNADQKRSRGSFSPSGGVGGTVTIVIEPSFSEYDTVVAIGLHECAHAFLRRHGIQLPDTQEDERLTDTAAILLGGGAYILRGYFQSSSRRLGYLSKAECEAVQEQRIQLHREWERQRDRELRRRQSKAREITSRLSPLVGEIQAMIAEFHPNRIVREASVVNEFHEQWQLRRPELDEAETLLAGLKSKLNSENGPSLESLKNASALEKNLHAFAVLLREWRDVERFQTEQFLKPHCSLQEFREKAAKDDPASMLDMMRLWDAHPATHRDAEIYFRALLMRNDRDGQYALGVCCKEGIAVPVDLKNAGYFLTQAAALGSEDAGRLLRELKS